MAKIPVGSFNGQIVPRSDVANVRDTHDETRLLYTFERRAVRRSHDNQAECRKHHRHLQMSLREARKNPEALSPVEVGAGIQSS